MVTHTPFPRLIVALSIMFLLFVYCENNYINSASCFAKNETNAAGSEINEHALRQLRTKHPMIPVLRYHNSSKAFNAKYYPLLDELGLTGSVKFMDPKSPLPSITFVSAISENHAGEGRSMVARLAKDHPDWNLILYDIGLRNDTRDWFKDACNVQVRDISLTHYGIDDLTTYRWKAIIIADALRSFPAIVWMDSSTFWSANTNISEFINKVKILGKENEPHVYFIGNSTRHSTFAVTTKGMYDYLSPQGDYFQKQLQANRMLIFRTKETIELALKWYVLCSLEAECMAPTGHQLRCQFKIDDLSRTYANCHRYDQSAINLILLSYENSFVGNWTTSYIWTDRNKERDMSPIMCGQRK